MILQSSPAIRRRLSASALALVLAFASACAANPSGPGGPAPDSGGGLMALYDASIASAAVYRAEDVLPLKAAVADGEGRVRVATYTNWGGYHADSTITLARDVWVTLVPEVRDSCRTFGAETTIRLEQLLGLPPGAGYDRFAEMSVRLEDLFRPAADPAVTTTRPCPDSVTEGCGTSFPPGVSPAHVRWIADNTLNHWMIPKGYPWTRLGYTYNWHPGSPRYGASEYVVKAGSQVRVLSVAPAAEYCAAG